MLCRFVEVLSAQKMESANFKSANLTNSNFQPNTDFSESGLFVW
jgi:hypothetical protein